MTSTVLDVTVLLLCVSASVVALGAAGDGTEPERLTADDIADRLVTETVTVSYRAPEAPNDTRTVHWTRAELLATIATKERTKHDKGPEIESFESAVRSVIIDGSGPRTQITVDIQPETPVSSEIDFTANPPQVTSKESRPTEDTANAPWIVDSAADPAMQSERASEAQSDRTASQEPLSIGTDPPRTADVTTAVVTQPPPSGSEAAGPVTIVIRRW